MDLCWVRTDDSADEFVSSDGQFRISNVEAGTGEEPCYVLEVSDGMGEWDATGVEAAVPSECAAFAVDLVEQRNDGGIPE